MSSVLSSLGVAAMTVTAGVLTAIAVRAWLQTHNPKVLLITLGFGTFFVKGLVLSAALFLSVEWGESFLPVSVAMDLAGLLLFYLAILKRTVP